MQVGITGYRSAGKTTVFNCLTGSDAETGFGAGREANRGNIKVPDERIDALTAIFNPKKTTFADISFVDLPSPPDSSDGNDGLDAQTVGELRRMDALVHVIRAFEDDGVPARNDTVDPVRDLIDFDTELALADIVVVDGRIERLKKEGKKTRELEFLEALAVGMEGGEKPARLLDLDEATLTALSGFQLLSLKPQIVLLDLSDDHDPEQAAALEKALVAEAEPRGIAVLGMRPLVEKEIAQLPAEDQASFLEDLGLTETARPRFIRACYAMLDLIAFFTVGEDEVRAWTIPKGTVASRAAGKIHSDLERGFIRAETVAYDDFMATGKKLAKARDAGKLRLEGKDYIVLDGDIINVRFNV
jgi:ribosome-binding ATPase